MKSCKFYWTTLFLLIVCTVQAWGQVPFGTRTITGSGKQYGEDMATDSAGNLYVTGSFENNINFGNGVSLSVQGQQDCFVAKFTPDGTALWATRISGQFSITEPWRMSVSPEGRVSVVGRYAFGLIVGQDTLAGDPNYDAFVVHLDTNGSPLWARSIAGSGTQWIYGVSQDDAGNVYTCGVFYSDTVFTGNQYLVAAQSGGSFIAKYSPTGNVVWFKAPQTPGTSYLDDLVSDGDGNLYVTGMIFSQFNWGGNTLTPNGTNYAFIAGFDSLGNYKWGHTGGNRGYRLAVDSAGYVYQCGTMTNTSNFQGITLTMKSTSYDVFIAKYEPVAGTIQWADNLGTSSSGSWYKMAVGPLGNVYLGGFYNGYLVVGSDTLAQGVGAAAYVVKYGLNGQPEWGLKQHGSGGSIRLRGISADRFGNVRIAGFYTGATYATHGNLFADSLPQVYVDNDVFISSILDTLVADSVWPGDADNNLVCNNVDMLYVGMGFGSTGFTRPNASNLWIGQLGPFWSDSIAGIDKRYADCNGDGNINFDDTLAINLNYGFTHNKTSHAGGGTPLTLTFLQDTVWAGDTAVVVVSLGSDTLQADSVYGLAYTLNYDNSLVDSSRIWFDYDSCWLGTKNSTMLTLNKDFYDFGRIEMAQVRNNQMSLSGSGEIVRINVIMIDDLSGKTLLSEMFRMSVSDITLIDRHGNPMPASGGTDSLWVVQEETGMEEATVQSVQVYPNPSSGIFTVDTHCPEACAVQVRDIRGSLLLRTEIRNTGRLDLSRLSAGIYYLELQLPDRISRHRIIITP